MIKLIVVEKTKEQFIKLGINEYLKRLQRFTKLEYIEVNHFNNLKLDNQFLIVLDIKGINYSSEELALFLNKNINNNLTFIIGDEDGIQEKLKKKASLLLSLSRMTFTHEFARLIFLEQLYRAITINKGMKYHK